MTIIRRGRPGLKLGMGLAAAAAAAVVLWLAFRPPATKVDAAVVSSGPLEVTVTEEGRTHIQERYVVSSPVTGYMPRLQWHVGDNLREGETIMNLQPNRSAALDPRSRAAATADLERAKAALQAAHTNAEAARARQEYASKEYLRLQKLFEAGTVSQQMLDAAEYEKRDADAHLRSAEFAIEVAQHEMDAARTRLDYAGDAKPESLQDNIAIRAPVGGIVLEVFRESEGSIQAGDPILAIGDPLTLEIVVEVQSTDAVRLESGMPVRIVRWGGNEALRGRVRLVEPVGFTKISALGVEEQRVRTRIELLSPPGDWQQLGDGYRVEAEFILWKTDDVLRVPTSALFRQEDRWMSFVIRDGRAYAVPVAIGKRGENWAQVVDGLSAGDTVVLYPDPTLSESARVTPHEQT